MQAVVILHWPLHERASCSQTVFAKGLHALLPFSWLDGQLGSLFTWLMGELIEGFMGRLMGTNGQHQKKADQK